MAGAVEADAGGLVAPHVGGADLSERPIDGVASGGADGDGLSLGEAEDFGNVAAGVVVVEHCGSAVGAVLAAVGAQVPCCGVYGVGRVVRTGRVDSAQRDGLVVFGEDGRLEPHWSFGVDLVRRSHQSTHQQGADQRLLSVNGNDRPLWPRCG
ncbi:hypothetical protein [Ferrimicrobium sp.]|uniref:hypothetical protein n=1 Tax=Ferrimicrobium sp. TaxID=2926050 RepID=UPI00263762A0|nr:hypothetical protein [Ferrimicrobium sp.]